MTTTITIDILQVGAGALIGFVLALLTKLKQLKRLNLTLAKLGMALGVEGVDDSATTSGAASLTNSNVGGDWVGRDKITSIGRQQNVFDKLQQVMQPLSPSSVPLVKFETHMSLEDNDSGFRHTLETLEKMGPLAIVRYFDACMERPAIRSQLNDTLRGLISEGWRDIKVTLNDHMARGIALRITASKSLNTVSGQA